MRDISYPDLLSVLRDRGAGERSLTAIAGPPAAGKSTIAERLCKELNATEPSSASILPMDGFHYDDAVLEARGWRPRKGAPHTFDVAGFRHALDRLRQNAEAEVAVPVFDRGLEVARAGARLIPQEVRHLIVEGNYLLLTEPPWAELARFFDTTVLIDVPLEEIERRSAERWRGAPAYERQEKITGNDLPNARLVLQKSVTPELRLRV